MPAINLRKFEIQIQTMGLQIGNAASFIQELTNIYEFYTDRTFRPNKESALPILIPSYNLQPQIQRLIHHHLQPQVAEYPAQSFQLVKELWKKSHLEYKQLAILLLGTLPFQSQLNILDVLVEWAISCDEESLLKLIAKKGLSTLIEQNPSELLDWIRKNLQNTDEKVANLGFLFLISFISNKIDKFLPDILKILDHELTSPRKKYFYIYREIFSLLVIQDPLETNYYIQKIVRQNSENKIIQQLVKEFGNQQT